MKYNSKEFKALEGVIYSAKLAAIEYRKLTGKPLGITAEVAEYEAAKHLKCTLMPPRTPGYDLIDCDGKKVQVKGRVIYNKKSQKVPTIGESTEKKPWSYVVLVLLDENYNAFEIYKLENEKLEHYLAQPRLNGSSRDRSASVRKFKLWSGLPIWQRKK